MSDWQPIETAPKDGRIVLLAKIGEILGVGDYWKPSATQIEEGARASWWICEGTQEVFPTHWMRLPAPPTPEGR